MYDNLHTQMNESRVCQVTEIHVLKSSVTEHSFHAEEDEHDIQVKIGFVFPEDAEEVLECKVRVCLHASSELPQKRLLRQGRIKAVSKLKRYFSAEDAAPENVFVV